MLKRACLVSIAALGIAAFGTFAHAQDLSSAYVEFGGGLGLQPLTLGNLVTDRPFTPSSTVLSPLGTGGSFYAAFGAELIPGLRAALEAHMTSNSGARFSAQGEGSGTLAVNLMTFAVMGQLWKDFEIANGITVHVGGGLGVGKVSAASTADNSVTTTVSTVGVAYMAGVGTSFDLGNGMVVTVDYRASGIGTGGIGTVPITTTYGPENMTGDLSTGLRHAVTAGIRIPIGMP